MERNERTRTLLLFPVAVLAAAGLWMAALAGAEDDPTVRARGYGQPTCDSQQQVYDTRITKAPKARTSSRKATVKFEAFYCEYPDLSPPAASTMGFECKLDSKKARSCSPPVKYRKLRKGKHKLRVRVTGPKSNPGRTGDPTPDVAKWKVTG